MAANGFAHLHLHSEYSLLDGAISISRLLKRCKELEMDTVAVTDHGNMFGAVEFYTKAHARHIKPIIGIEAYIAPGSRFDRTKTSISDAAFHLILLAENNAGYRNLLKLASVGYLEGFYYRPRIDKEILAELNEGLIATSACIKGEVAAMLARGDEKRALAAAQSYVEIFGAERFFIELQKHEGDNPQIYEALVDISRKLGVALVATNDVHFLQADDYEAHNCLCCIGTGKNADDDNRMIYPKDLFLQSPEQMRSLFAETAEACDNTLAIAERCNVELDLKTHHAPRFAPDDGSKPEEYLTQLVYDGAKQRYGEIADSIRARIDRELDVIESKGFASYFLIVWDFCNYARNNGIAVGARGSAVGTVVGYCLGLCNVDPIRYNLLFERFMDPQRNEMPDVDIDICQDGRARVIEYVRQKYGHVAQIITFGTMKARAVIRDLCRVLGVPLAEADRLAKLVPASLDMTLDKALDTEPELKKAYEENEQTRRVIDVCRRLEGLSRHASVHAAGVVIADEPLTNFVPLYKPPGSEDIITQFEGPMVEKVGLLKMDFLGLKTLSVLERSCSLVKHIHGEEIDIENIRLDDAKVFELFSTGRTKGVFQFESGGMQELLIKMQPDRIEDLIAANALYRPGPMILIPDYVERKHGAKWELPHPIMNEILEETYGIMIYQEQVMRICNKLGGIGLREAYGLIKAISKKKSRIIAREKERFVAGCVAKGLTQQQANGIFELIERFAGYGFNKSHSTRYAMIAYQTAYMKAHYPVEFMAALLTYEMDNTEKVVDYIGECKAMGVEVLPPDINESDVDFTPVYKNGDGDNGVIRFGLAGVKGVGEKAVEQIIAARAKAGRFKNLFHFCEHVDLRAANKQVLEALIKAGAFDRLGGHRAQMMAALERAMQSGSDLQADKQNGQMNFFGQMAQPDDSEISGGLPDVAPWPEQEMLAFEKDVLGFYVTSNPLSHYADVIDFYSTKNTSQLADAGQDNQIVIGGMITKIRYNLTKTGKNAGSKMAVFVLEDLQGEVEVVLFPGTLKKYTDIVLADTVVFVRGNLDDRRGKANILAEELVAHDDDLGLKLVDRVRIEFHSNDVSAQKVAMVRNVCVKYKGSNAVDLAIRTGKGTVLATADKSLCVWPSPDFCKDMVRLVGRENFRLIFRRGKARNSKGRSLTKQAVTG